jgi:hypothetical protein
MLLFKKRFHAGLVSGDVRLTFRRWKKTHVKEGGRYRCHPIGVLVVDAIQVMMAEDITSRDAALSGFESREELMEYLASGPEGALKPLSPVFRIELHHGGDGDRVDLALEDALSLDDVREIREKLAKLDKVEPWTSRTLRLILKNPRIAASKLAQKLGRETLPFKEDVRKLKRLGLTQSFEVGYEVSPRGLAYLAAKKPKPVSPAKKRVKKKSA